MNTDTDDARGRLVNAVTSRRDRLRRLWRYGGVLFLWALLANAVFGEQGVIETIRVQRQHRLLQRELAGLRADNQRRLQLLERHDDPAYIEELSRRTLGLIKPGEIVVVLREAEPGAGEP